MWICEDLIALPYDRSSYEIAARPIWDIIATESDAVEPVSPELCYAVVEGKDILTRVRRLTEIVAPLLSVPVRVGIGRTKMLARRAAESADMDDVISIQSGEEVAFLARLPLTESKIALKDRQTLEKLGVKTLGDLLGLPPQRLPRQLRRVGQQLYQMMRGHDADPVKPLWPPLLIRGGLIPIQVGEHFRRLLDLGHIALV